MNGFKRRPADRPRPKRAPLVDRLDMLERRELLTSTGQIWADHSQWTRFVEPNTPTLRLAHPIGDSPRQLSFLDNDGKVLTGMDRDGDTWTLTLHGPGTIVVTDAVPNDGVLADELNTIQLIGTNLNSSYLTGQVTGSARVLSDGIVRFNHLIAQDGVASIVLNGFSLATTVLPSTDVAVNTGPEVFLPGGVRQLYFHSIDSFQDLGAGDQPIEVVIGDPTTPSRIKPNVWIDHIFNTVIDTAGGFDNSVPITTPNVLITVNGRIHKLEFFSVSSRPLSAGEINAILNPPSDLINSGQEPYLGYQQSLVSPVAITGRTAIQTFSIEGLKVVGGTQNLTASRTVQPFTRPFSGMDRIGHAVFGGNADAVALDVSNGRIGKLRFLRGLGNPGGLPYVATNSGTPIGKTGYPYAGLQGGVVAARRIGKVEAAPASFVLQTSQDPSNIQLLTTNQTNYFQRPGDAMVNSTIAANRSIGATRVIGNLRNSLVAAGYDYRSYVRGLDPVRQPGSINGYRQRGDLVDSVVQASYRPVNGVYGDDNDQAGNGRILAHLNGVRYQTTKTPSGVQNTAGSGFFAKFKSGYAPPPDLPRRVHSVLVR